jgi:energy-coupling factor transport system permease protein
MTATPTADARGATAWHALDPLTRLVIAAGTLVAAVLLGGVLCLLLLAVFTVIVPAAVARQVQVVLRTSLLLALPLAVSVVIVNVLFAVGTTEQGLSLAAEVVARILTMAGAAVLFYATTRPAELVASLQHHGVSPRLTFVIHNSVATIPRLAERAREVTDAQRARGLDTEGSWLRRARGVMAVAAPTVLGAIGEVETRTMALETRGFTRPGRPTVLWPPRDSTVQRLLRWGVVAGLLSLALARATGTLPC